MLRKTVTKFVPKTENGKQKKARIIQSGAKKKTTSAALTGWALLRDNGKICLMNKGAPAPYAGPSNLAARRGGALTTATKLKRLGLYYALTAIVVWVVSETIPTL